MTTPGVKWDDGKDRWDLVPWAQLRHVVAAISYGARKYSDDNWQRVEPHRYRAAAMRHFSAFCEGERKDVESGLHHLAHAMCCLLFLLWHDDKEARNEGE
jgi:hypothetical protein